MLQQGTPTSWLDDDRYDAALQAETARFAEAVHDADPARPVPICPEWTLADLTEHVGQAQRWVTVVLERRAPVPNAQVRAHGPADVTVRGRAADLLLVLTRRAAPPGRVEVAGDGALFAHWLGHSRF